MNDVAIRVDSLGKRYRIGAHRREANSRLQSFGRWMLSPFSYLSTTVREASPEETLWALRDISFEVQRGEVLGVIGLNGAGKSTLLKILSRITEPTEGRAEIHGRVASLLEVGTGFHQEMTGRENIYMNGSILGMRKEEIDRKFDEIVEFAEVERFIDTPVKRYSTGMYVRLAFAVAAHLEPEILLVDEVLAVGDVGFQRKCLGKMEDVSKGGRTVLFVSHNMGTISTLCGRAALLNGGQLEFVGPVQEAVSTYLSGMRDATNTEITWALNEAPGTDKARFKGITVSDGDGIGKHHFQTTEPVVITVEYWVLTDSVPINVALGLWDENDTQICAVVNFRETQRRSIDRRGVYRTTCVIPGGLLNAGKHWMSAALFANTADTQVNLEHCVGFETIDNNRVHHKFEKWAGIIKPEFEWQSERIGGS